MDNETKEIQVSPIVMPAVSTKEALAAWEAYLELKKAIVEEEDVMTIQGRTFLKKSYWRKVATFFNLNVTVVSERREEFPNGDYGYHFTCEAKATNGRVAAGTGSCSAYEKAKLVDGVWKSYDKYSRSMKIAEPNSVHNIRSTAETRAWNRAVSNLVGGGEVSADELVSSDNDTESTPVPYTKRVQSEEPRTPLTRTTSKYTKCEECGSMGPYHRATCSHFTPPAGVTTGDKIVAPKTIQDELSELDLGGSL